MASRAESDPQLTASKETGKQSYNHKEQNSANNLSESRSTSSLEPAEKSPAQTHLDFGLVGLSARTPTIPT